MISAGQPPSVGDAAGHDEDDGHRARSAEGDFHCEAYSIELAD
jgi:hypothetical protein